MNRELTLTKAPIVEPECVASRLASPESGACVWFLGSVRGTEEGCAIRGIHYEAYEAMARHQFQRIFDEIEARWPIQSIRLVHRLGPVMAGEPSIWVEVASPHRAEGFAACEFLISEMKQRVPIWKQPIPL